MNMFSMLLITSKTGQSPAGGAKHGRKGKAMEIKKGMFFRGDINSKIILIINASEEAVTYKCMESGNIFTVGRKMFEHCYLTRI